MVLESSTPLSIVYVLTNPAMPGLVKIGRTSQNDAKARLDQLYSTGVPVPFELIFACRVPDSAKVEQALHRAFAPHRINPRREFFQIEPDQAIVILRLLHVDEETIAIESQPSTLEPIEEEATRTLRRRRPHMNFDEMGIPIGAMLNHTRSATIVMVISPRKVMFDGEELALTVVTRRVLGVTYDVQPASLWTYEGRTLRAIYEETYGNLEV